MLGKDVCGPETAATASTIDVDGLFGGDFAEAFGECLDGDERCARDVDRSEFIGRSDIDQKASGWFESLESPVEQLARNRADGRVVPFIREIGGSGGRGFGSGVVDWRLIVGPAAGQEPTRNSAGEK